MSYQLDNLSRELQQLKYEVLRKVESEDYRRLKSEVDTLDRKIDNLNRNLQEQANDIQEIKNMLEQQNVHP